MQTLVADLFTHTGASPPFAYQNWAVTKAAYRFFANPRVEKAGILAGHFAATAARVRAASGPVLVPHDITEFVFQREAPARRCGPAHRPRLQRGRSVGGHLTRLTV